MRVLNKVILGSRPKRVRKWSAGLNLSKTNGRIMRIETVPMLLHMAIIR